MRISVRLQPRASKNEVLGWQGETLRVRVTAPPVEGEANTALIQVLAAALKLPKSAFRLAAGRASRNKIVDIDADEGELKRKLGSYGRT